MKATEAYHPATICDQLLCARKQYNLEHSILRSHNVVIDRLLARKLELREAFSDLHKKLHQHPHALDTFFGVLLDATAFWGPERNVKARAERAELERINVQIAGLGEGLASLLRRRDQLHNHSGFRSNTCYHIGDVIKVAGEHNGHFTMYLEEELELLQARYDLKYWPLLDACIEAIAEDARNAVIEASDPLTEAATDASRSSLADYFKALFVAIAENTKAQHGWIPNNFRPSDSSLASLANCALDLVDDELLDGSYVKRLRQRLRA